MTLTAPVGAFYQFFSVDGRNDSKALAIDLVDKANVGLAPGTAFGPGGETGLEGSGFKPGQKVTIKRGALSSYFADFEKTVTVRAKRLR